jgi:4-deoxy-L-threo-5-hexosulose-uronate ketol-isomerase
MTTDELRARFLVQGLFQPDVVTLRLIDLDRVVLGGAVRTTRPLRLEPPPALLADFFCARRELGVLNIGGAGIVTVDRAPFALGPRDLVYVGRGSRNVEFSSDDPAQPARREPSGSIMRRRHSTEVARRSASTAMTSTRPRRPRSRDSCAR